MASRARASAYVGGIGSGKTWAGAARIGPWLQAKTLGMVTAPTYRMLRDATLRTFLELWGDICTLNKTDMVATFPSGAEVLFRTTDDPQHLRGPNLWWWWGDEAALYSRETWPIMLGRLRGSEDAAAWLTTTPRGRNWLYSEFVQHPQPGREIIRCQTRDNPYLPASYVDDVYRSYSGQYADQELAGEFVSWEGLVYEEFSRERHVAETPTAPPTVVIAGVDEGYTNPAAIVAVQLDPDGRAHVPEIIYGRQILQDSLVAMAQDLAQRRQIATFYADPSAAGLIAALRAAGLRVVEADNAVFAGIQTVKGRLAMAGDGRPRLTVAPTCPDLLAEFEQYAWEPNAPRDRPVKANDHALDALRYALHSPQPSRDSYVIPPTHDRESELLGEHTI